MTLPTNATLPSNVVSLRRSMKPTMPLSTPLWAWLMVGLMFTTSSFIVMCLTNHFHLIRISLPLDVDSSTSDKSSSERSTNSVPTNTSK